MDRSQATGVAIIAVAAIQLLLFVVGLARKSYLAVAIPVGLVLAGVSALAIWVGWTMMTTETDLPEPDEPENTTA
jgi:phosphotransferase system  glucose/maltose/N-acetylglucosamine-specific IIC component